MKIIHVGNWYEGAFFLGNMVIVARFESRLAGVFYRIFRKPNGTYVAKTTMDCPFEFVCSVNGSNVNWL